MNRHILGLVGPCVVAVTMSTGCKKEEPPPPPLPAPPAVTAAPAPLQLKPEDAGVKVIPPDAGPKKAKGGGGGGGLGPCCAALAQNAASMPDPTQKMYMTQAAQMCQAFLAQGMGKQVVGQLQGMLRGSGMPGACR